MQGQKEFWQAQLMGLKRLPEESGAWGVLLPTSRSNAKSHEAQASEFVSQLNPSYLQFDTGDFLGMHRGTSFFLAAFVGFFALVTMPAVVMQRSSGAEVAVDLP
jgi:hypothetical protein